MAQCAGTNNCTEVNDLKMYPMLKSGLFPEPKVLKVMDGVTLSIEKGCTMGLMGELGCGRTMAGHIIFKLYQAAMERILYRGMDITGLSNSQMTPYRKKIQMILRDPYTSLDPRKDIGDVIAEPTWAMELHTRKDKNDHVRELTKMVGPKPDHINRYPHEFLGGQRQRIDIVRALVAEPEFIVCDEPISALNVSIQAQIINILEEPQDEFHLAYLFTSHDLSMVRYISSGVGVMYLDSLIGYIQVGELYDNMFHPYTQSLISAVLVADPKLVKEDQRIAPEGNVPSPINPAPGCPFRSKCRYTKDIYGQVESELKVVNDKYRVAYHFFD